LISSPLWSPASSAGLPEVTYYLAATGLGYVPQEGLAAKDGTYFFNAKPFNAVPMLVWDGLGHAYEDLGKSELALKAYKKALACAPSGGPWARKYQDSARRIEKAIGSQSGRSRAGGADQAAASGSASAASSAQAAGAAAAPAPAAGRTGGD
jgi:tetratricopeptide (TPR) repeat protein